MEQLLCSSLVEMLVRFDIFFQVMYCIFLRELSMRQCFADLCSLGLLCQEKAKSVKRSGSGSVASVTSERSECDSDGWVTATCWVVPGRRGCGGTMGRILSAVM